MNIVIRQTKDIQSLGSWSGFAIGILKGFFSYLGFALGGKRKGVTELLIRGFKIR